MKKKKILSLFLAAAMTVTVFTGCGQKKKDTSTEIKVHATKSELEDGCIYVRHKDGTFDQVYPGENDKAKKTNIFWFKSDFKKIPHLVQGNGDTLVYYSTSDVEAKFTFQRYYDLGYSVGICGMTPDKKTGRYSISTDKDDFNTYPGSSADEILKTANDNKTAVIASIGGKEIKREVTNTDDASTDTESDTTDTTDENTDGTTTDESSADGSGTDKVSSEMVTKYGTIKNLTKNALYTVVTYNGSIRKSVNIRANVRILGYAGKYVSSSYSYGTGDDGNLITIGIPQWFNTGYYTIQTDKTTVGMFALVNGNSYDDTTDFNNPNAVPDTDEEKAQTDVDAENGTDNTAVYDSYMDNVTFDKSGYVTIVFTIDGMTDEEASEMEGFSAGFFTDGTNVEQFVEKSPGVFSVGVNVTEGTSYKIGYSGLPSALSDRAVLNYQFENQQ
ncbi:MAG: hypothetical protein ACI4CS_02375 [Candidatus Weimeria sp.]